MITQEHFGGEGPILNSLIVCSFVRIEGTRRQGWGPESMTFQHTFLHGFQIILSSGCIALQCMNRSNFNKILIVPLDWRAGLLLFIHSMAMSNLMILEEECLRCKLENNLRKEI